MPRTYDPTESFQDSSFPKGGVDQSQAFARQPARPGPDGAYLKTTRFGKNVRAAPLSDRRTRGGQRMGLRRLFQTRPGNIEWITQQLDVLYLTGDVGMPQTSLSGRVVQILAVSQGNVFTTTPGGTAWSQATNNSGETPPLNISGVMFSAQNIQKLWICDGINYCYYNPPTNSVELWTATAGTMPKDTDNNVARLIETWRGRTILSGLLKDPQNIFMSAVGDPRNFDYAPATPSQTQAVALNLSPLGLIGEPVMAMIPYSDDVLVVGMANSIRAIRGDPQSGGQIDLITDKIGMVWGRPWAMGPDGTVYFFSNKTGIYRLDPRTNQAPVKVSTPIDQFLVNLDMGGNHIRMAWDEKFDTLQVFISPIDAPGLTYHFALETRQGAWWLDRLGSTTFDPLCCCVMDGNTPGDRVVLIGSWDGYVRRFDPTAQNDDGFPIQSEVWIGPFLTPNLDEVKLESLQAVLSETSGEITYSIHAARSAEEAFSSPAITDGTWQAGRNQSEAIRIAGHAIYVRIVAQNPWQLESIRALVATTGKIRRRS